MSIMTISYPDLPKRCPAGKPGEPRSYSIVPEKRHSVEPTIEDDIGSADPIKVTET